jgi:hypothetical protein
MVQQVLLLVQVQQVVDLVVQVVKLDGFMLNMVKVYNNINS